MARGELPAGLWIAERRDVAGQADDKSTSSFCPSASAHLCSVAIVGFSIFPVSRRDRAGASIPMRSATSSGPLQQFPTDRTGRRIHADLLTNAASSSCGRLTGVNGHLARSTKCTNLPEPILMQHLVKNHILKGMEPYNIALLGCGTVGSGVAKLLLEHPQRLAARAGRPLVLRRVVVRDPEQALRR